MTPVFECVTGRRKMHFAPDIITRIRYNIKCGVSRKRSAYCRDYFVDKRAGSEWFNELNEDDSVRENKEIAGEWKCPYHGRQDVF